MPENETLGERFKRLQEAARKYVQHGYSPLPDVRDRQYRLFDAFQENASDPAFAEYVLGLERDKRERVEHFADVRRIAEWIAARGGALQDPALAFTEGPERYLATMIYHVSDALERCTEANEQLESQLTTANQAREAAEKRVRELEGQVTEAQQKQQKLASERDEAARSAHKARREVRFKRWYG